MKKIVLFFTAFLIVSLVSAQPYYNHFRDSTLRLDYIFSGNSETQQISLDELASLTGWWGKTIRMNELPLKGNGQLTVRDLSTEETIYITSFSSLFQEWLVTEEANKINRSFEQVFLVPFPRNKVEVEIILLNNSQAEMAILKHIIDPEDILIRTKGRDNPTPYRQIQKGKSPRLINIAILAEGYTREEAELFYQDAVSACESLFGHAPFNKYRERFNVVAVAAESTDSGVTIPHEKIWKDTPVSSHFDTFYSERYLTTSRLKAVHDLLVGLPYEHIIILANTSQYGGGGIYNSYTLTTAHHPLFAPVVVHEFGHSFAGLGDEYFYENDTFNDMYPPDKEPWEQNITTLVEFNEKWEKLIPPGTPIPTLTDNYPIGLFEGGGYTSKGIYRPAYDCRMRTNEYPAFCPVCQHSIEQLILFYTEN